MRKRVGSLAAAFARTRTVPIADCVHFCAYRYGRGEINPYEEYATGLAEGLPLQVVRDRFVEHLRRYRPRDLGEALGVQLSQPYPIWHLPWRTPAQVRQQAGWVADAASVVDVMTYFSDAGIPRSVIEKEFRWHENAFAAIAAQGYQPERYSYIVARELRADRSVYLVTDGNHRLSALSALQGESVRVKLPMGTTVIRDNLDRWPLVKAGAMARLDALAVFDAYFIGNQTPARSERLADVVD